MPKTPYDPKKFFWWRNYKEFGTGIAGDLFIHLISGIHFMTDSKGPSSVFSTGDLTYWKDGRNVPDVMTGVISYPATAEHPAFQVLLKVNLASGTQKGGEGSRIVLTGTEGAIEFAGNGFTLTRSKLPKAPGYGGWDAFDTYPKAMQQQILDEYNKKYSEADRKAPSLSNTTFAPPQGYNEHLDHHMNFFEAIRNKKPVVEDAAFGFRAAAPCLACNDSYFNNKVIKWDAQNMKMA
jgi:predicted dehydrogenase